MSHLAYLDRIASNPQILRGRTCIKGTRIPITVILDNLAVGQSEAAILANYPTLKPEDIRAAIGYAAALARDEDIIPTPPGPVDAAQT